jgi:acetyltransferase-like isoleucine patch superfamily enzyme
MQDDPFLDLSQRVFMNQDPRYSGYEIGEWSYGTPEILSWGEGATIKIGRYCSFASGVEILLGGEHRVDWITTYPFNVFFREGSGITGQSRSKGDIVIGNDVWVGKDALILSGVSIGDGAVIGARSVVTGNVEPYSIVAGNPARHKKYRFSKNVIRELLSIAWWDWPLEKTKEAFPLLLSANLEDFISKYK